MIKGHLLQRALSSLVLLVLTPFSVPAQERLPRVELPGTELRTIESKCVVGQRYLVQVCLPEAYHQSTRAYPVLYVLDADKSLGMARDIVDWMAWNRQIRPVIVVGISYGEGTRVWWDNRSRDLAFCPDRANTWGHFPLAGGGSNFLSFLKTELIPLIDGSYRTLTDERGIAGLSFGGLFAVWAMFEDPGLFNRFIISGPALLWDNEAIFGCEEEYADSHDSLPVRVHSSVGELDSKDKMILSWRKFTDLLERREYKGLVIRNEVLAGESHISAWPVSFTRGLKFVFPPEGK